MQKRTGLILLCCLLVAGVANGKGKASKGAPAALNNQVKVEGGTIAGTAVGEKQDVRVYKGIPFAAPPTGNLRWKAPQPVVPWSGVRDATQFSPACPQPDTLSRLTGRKLGPTSEDCLCLNVWTPAKAANEKLPVMVWIHGGSYIAGEGSTPSYNGEALARQGAVIVTINYRLGPLGFFAHPLLSKESGHDSSGNYGLLDQIAALQWVRKNIAAFGGDAARVTIFGESAGAGSICYLMVSPLAKGLFHRAIAESGSAFGPNRHLRETWYGQEPMEKVGERVARDFGCDQEKDPLAALRAKSAEEILKGSKMASNFFFGGDGTHFAPIVDGWVVPDDPGVIFAAGKQHAVPLIVGSNADEGTIFTLTAPQMAAIQYQKLMRQLYPERADEILTLYPASGAAEVKSAINRLIGDAAFIGGARYFASTQSRVSKAFLYHFTWVAPTARGKMLGAFHSSEIPHVFGTLDTSALSEAQKASLHSRAMMEAWVRFAATGDPNPKGGTLWPVYDAAKDQHLEFGTEVKVKSGLRKQQCDLFEKIGVERLAKRRPGTAH